MENDMNQFTSIPNPSLPEYEKPTLIPIGDLKEIVRGSGSATFDGVGDTPDCTTSNGVASIPDDNC